MTSPSLSRLSLGLSSSWQLRSWPIPSWDTLEVSCNPYWPLAAVGPCVITCQMLKVNKELLCLPKQKPWKMFIVYQGPCVEPLLAPAQQYSTVLVACSDNKGCCWCRRSNLQEKAAVWTYQNWLQRTCTGPSLMLLRGLKMLTDSLETPPHLLHIKVKLCSTAVKQAEWSDLVKCTVFLVAICDRWRWSRSLFSYCIFHPQMEKVGRRLNTFRFPANLFVSYGRMFSSRCWWSE